MADLPRAVMKMTSSIPAATHSSTISWTLGVSTSGNISFGIAFVAGRNRVPSPATGRTALRTRFVVMSWRSFYARFHPTPAPPDTGAGATGDGEPGDGAPSAGDDIA